MEGGEEVRREGERKRGSEDGRREGERNGGR